MLHEFAHSFATKAPKVGFQATAQQYESSARYLFNRSSTKQIGHFDEEVLPLRRKPGSS